MGYEVYDSPIHGKILSKNGKPVIENYETSGKLSQRFNSSRLKMFENRYMIKLPESINDIEECDCEIVGQERPNSQMMPSYNEEPRDNEVHMARADLYRTAKLAIMLHDMLKNVGEERGLDGWVQRKLTRAADYIESVFDYMDYEMRYPEEMNEDPQVPGQLQPPQGQQSPQVPGEKAPATATGANQTPGMVKMAKVDTNGKIQGQPIIVPAAQVKSKQQAGFHVIGESASSGASSAGGMAVGGINGGMGSTSVGSLFGGTYNQKKKKRKIPENGIVDREIQFKTNAAIDQHDRATQLVGVTRANAAKKKKFKKPTQTKTEGTMSSAEKESNGPKFTGYWKGTDKGAPGKKMVGGGP